MKRIACISVLVCILGIVSVAKGQKTEPIVIKVTDPKKYSSDFDEFIIERSFLPLETSPECLMPGVGARVYFYKDHIFVHFATQWGVYILTKDGKFINHINPMGKGPYECISIYSIDIYNDELFLFDSRGGKILVVDFEGNPKRTIKTPLYPYDLIHNDKGQILMYQQKEMFEGKPYDIVGFDESKDSFFGYQPAGHLKRSHFDQIEAFFSTSNGPVMAVTACDTVFAVNGPFSQPLYILDYGKRGLTEEEKNTFTEVSFRNIKREAMAQYKGWHQVGDMVSFLYHTEKRSDNLLFYDFSEKKFYGGKWEYPDFEFGRITYPSGTFDNSYLFLIQALTIIEEVKEHPERCSEELKAIAKSLKENDNPVIMKWKVK